MWKILWLTLLFSCRPLEKFDTNAKWQIQFNGIFKDMASVEVFDLDLFATSEAQIKELHKQGKKVICYFSAGTLEEGRPDTAQFPAATRGNKLKDWEKESWLDIKNPQVRSVMINRMELAREKNCDAIDPDNVDEFTHQSGFTITKADQLEYNKFLAQEAHRRNLLIGLKNDLQQVGDLVDDFDFAINESCADYDECQLLKPFVLRGKPVFAISYQPKSKKLCDQAKKLHMNLIFKNKALDEKVKYCQ